jgi:long-chain acyl-CoA synthetase
MDKTTHDNILKAHYFSDKSATDYMVKYKNILELLNERLEQCRHEEYMVFYADDHDLMRFTYGEFINRVTRLSNFLIGEGMKKGDRIATFSHNHADTVVLYYACWALGLVVVPINVGEEHDRIDYILSNSHSRMIFTRTHYLSRVSDVCKMKDVRIMDFDEFRLDDYKEGIDLDYMVDKEDECLIVYTSGTTGNPKGVVLTQYNLMVDAMAIADWHNLHRGDVMMCVLPIHHVNGTVVTIMTTMFYGGKLVLNQKFHTHFFLERIQDEKVKIVSVVPTLLQFLLHTDEESSKYNLSRFSHIICGAGPLTCELAKNFEDRFGLRIVHGYGLSETTCYSCFIPINLTKEEHSRWQNQYGFPAIGVPIECNEMEIHNDKGESLPENEKGEIVIRGHNVMKYYYDNDEVNRKTFEFGWFRSGDEGFFKYDSEGRKNFFITGRIKELIIRGGVNISPLEIDEVLSSIDFVKSGIAVGFENDWYGEEVGALVMLKDGVLTGRSDTELKDEILKLCKMSLPSYKSPKVVIFSDSIPVTSTGKYQRNKVKDLFREFKEIQFKGN